MVVLVSLEARQKPLFVVRSDVIGRERSDEFNATGFRLVEKTADFRHHDVLDLTVGRGCQSDFRVLTEFNLSELILSPAGCQIQKTDRRHSSHEVLASCCS